MLGVLFDLCVALNEVFHVCAGKQRYYSQGISKTAYAIERFNASGDAANSLRFQSQLNKALQLWYQGQHALLNGDSDLDIPGSSDKTVRNLFTQADRSFQAIYAAGVQILLVVSGKPLEALNVVPPRVSSSGVGITANVNIISANEDEFLLLSNRIVKRFEVIGERHIRILLIITWIFTSLILITLVLEGLLIVRPVLTRMHLLVSERFDLLHASLE